MRNDIPFFLTKLTVLAILVGCGDGDPANRNKEGGEQTTGRTKEQASSPSKDQIKINQVKSVNAAKVIGGGLNSYFEEKLKMPSADKWCDVALTEIGSGKVFVSPQHPEFKQLLEKAGEGEKISHYAMNNSVAGDGFSGSKVLVFECDLGWNGSGGLEDALKYMEKNKLEKIAVSKGNGSSIAVTQEELKELEW